MVNPTQTKTWQRLFEHKNQISSLNILDEFQSNTNRAEDLSLEIEGLLYDFSKNLINQQTVNLLIDLAKEQKVNKLRDRMFNADPINITEDRAVLHTALRDFTAEEIRYGNKDILRDIEAELQKIGKFVNTVRDGHWKGFTGKRIKDIVNIGIGGSDLGPKMAVTALRKFADERVNCHFVSNIDGSNLEEILPKLDQETTLFIVTSKKFTTKETLMNAETAKDWFMNEALHEKYIARHFVAVSANTQLAVDFGIDADNVFKIWDFVGGRYSMWSAVGLPIALYVGYDNFIEILEGAHAIDQHFLEAPLEKNIPVIMALVGIWNINFLGAETQAILPYSHDLRLLPSYLQQLEMESNGKSVDRDDQIVNYKTAPIIWGASGTEMQHSFFQLMLQGNRFIPADFIGFRKSLSDFRDHHDMLMANFIGATEALIKGRNHEDPHKIVQGNRPSSILLFDKLEPKTLGKLIALYEHKVFVQGIIWNINSFDQFGVELGKELSNKIEDELAGNEEGEHDGSTKSLLSKITN